MRPLNDIASDAPDDRLAVGGASCSLWWRNAPPHAAHRVGAIGSIVAHDCESGTRLLAEACIRLAAQGCTLAIGPMDGDTWHRYRAITERGEEPPFFLEPDDPDDIGASFGAAGFEVAARYLSALQERLDPASAQLEALEKRAARRGTRIRTLDMSRFRAELGRIHAVCMASFQKSFLFKPIAEKAFVDRHAPIAACLRPELVLLAEKGGVPVAFFLAMPDVLEAERGEAPETVIVKTVAVLPEMQHEGLGALLAARAAATARAMGFRRAIHALMHMANDSTAWSAKQGRRVIRRYALYARTLC